MRLNKRVRVKREREREREMEGYGIYRNETERDVKLWRKNLLTFLLLQVSFGR